MATSLSSCNIIGAAANLFSPPQKSEPKYVPPKDKKVLVFVDDRPTPVSWEPIKRDLTEELNAQLVEHKVVQSTIPYDRLLDLRSREPNFSNLGVAAIGQKLGADLVLYVNITSFRLKEDERTPVWEGRIQTCIRWIDATAVEEDRARLWPKMIGSEGYIPEGVALPAKEESSLSYGTTLSHKLAVKMADIITKLFYIYEIPPIGSGQDTSEGIKD